MIRALSIIHYHVYGGPHNRNLRINPFLEAQGVCTTVLLPDQPGNAAERLRQGGMEVVTLPLSRVRATRKLSNHLRWSKQFWEDVIRIRKVIHQRKINVVLINGLANPQGAIAAKLERVPVVWQILDTYTPMLLRWLIMPVFRTLADVIMCTGQQVAKEHPGATSFGKRLVLFYPPVDLAQFANSPERRKLARDRLGLTKDAFVVGNVSNITPSRGHRIFLRAAARIKGYVPKARFVLLGATHETHRAYTESLWKEAIRLGLTMGHDLIVKDPGARVAELAPAFDVFWTTSVPRSEGIPTAIEEAMALGIPVIATTVGSIPEIVLEGKTGFLVHPYDDAVLADHTIALYKDKALRKKMAKAAHDMAAQNFGAAKCARTQLYAYKLALRI
jgi:glycosyltransferase involved in cell wall biosynthesis